MDIELRSRIDRVRAALATLPDGALIGWVGPPRSALPAEFAGVEQLAEFLRVADGAHCDDFVLYGVEDLAGPGPHDWLAEGAARWLTVGRNHVFPVVLDRATQEVVELDADGAGEVLRRLGPFRQLIRGLFGAEFLALSHGLGERWAALVQHCSSLAEPGVGPDPAAS